MEQQDWRNLVDLVVEQRKSLYSSQAAFAEQLGLSQTAVASFECKRHSASLKTFLRMANALDCKVLVVPADKAAAFDDD